jgi:RNA polymerase sigma-70 factor (family 1)
MKSLNEPREFLSNGPAFDLTFHSIYEKSYAGLVYYAYKILGNQEEAEDMAQNAFIAYWNCKHQVNRDPRAVKSFLYTTVRNCCVDAIKHRSVVRKFHDQLDAEPVDENDIENEIVRAEVLSEISYAIEKLPVGCRQIFEMSFHTGLKNYEIAELLCLSINTVKTQKQRALQILRLKLTSRAMSILLVLVTV